MDKLFFSCPFPAEIWLIYYKLMAPYKAASFTTEIWFRYFQDKISTTHIWGCLSADDMQRNEQEQFPAQGRNTCWS